ncbi:MAG: hypothetical protein L3J41_15830 [Melioribacteraceae bacterium]|nr:hypothetical protein [Melioribacteraceae bacterium]
MKQFIELYNNSRNVLQSIESISKQAEKLNIKNFKILKTIELIKQLVNNSLAETLVLSDFLYQLSIINDHNELEELLSLIEFDCTK